MKIDQDLFFNELVKLGDREPPSKNSIAHYLPYRNNGGDFSYPYVAGAIISFLTEKSVSSKFTLDDLATQVKSELEEMTGETKLGELAHEIYFSEAGVLSKLSPQFVILNTVKGEQKVSQSSKQLEELFCSMFVDKRHEVKSPTSNFIESVLVKSYQNMLKPLSKRGSLTPYPYLPFIADCFSKDIEFLCQRPQFFLEKFEDFLGLYNFLYCSQLGANIRNWKTGEPTSVEHYFIIDTEKCSSERKASGSYKELRQSVENIFPVLTFVNELNTVLGKDIHPLPLWKVKQLIEELPAEKQTELGKAIYLYAAKFSSSDPNTNGRGLKERLRSSYQDGVVGELDRLVHFYMDQFDQSRELTPSSKHEMKSVKYLKPFEQEVAKHFVQARGRLGKVLVINQDYLLMLTNIVIGKKGEMRLQEILGEFEKRGVYLDKQSQLSLITFYERIGNIKRMSDSGDAVYVKSTV